MGLVGGWRRTIAVLLAGCSTGSSSRKTSVNSPFADHAYPVDAATPDRPRASVDDLEPRHRAERDLLTLRIEQRHGATVTHLPDSSWVQRPRLSCIRRCSVDRGL